MGDVDWVIWSLFQKSAQNKITILYFYSDPLFTGEIDSNFSLAEFLTPIIESCRGHSIVRLAWYYRRGGFGSRVASARMGCSSSHLSIDAYKSWNIVILLQLLCLLPDLDMIPV